MSDLGETGLKAEDLPAARALMSWADSLASSLLIVDDQRTCVWKNKAALAMLDRSGVFFLRSGAVVAAHPEDTERLDSLIQSLRTKSGSEVFKSRQAGDRLVVHGSALSEDSGHAVLMIFDPHAPEEPALPDLRGVYGLTTTEQEVVTALLAGRSVEDIAATAGNSVLTVRTHIKRAYLKMGVNSQAELLIRLQGFQRCC